MRLLDCAYSKLLVLVRRAILGWIGVSSSLGAVQPFDFKSTPSAADWRAFFSAPPQWRTQLWTEETRRGVLFRDWSWTWRTAWLRACEVGNDPWCEDLLRQGLDDPALVVRHQAVASLGQRWAGTTDPDHADLLAKGLRDPRNWRNKKPLFIMRRILLALHSVGGPHALAVGRQFVAANRPLRDYWTALGPRSM